MEAASEDSFVTPLTRTEQAHNKYRQGQYQEALQLYTDALAIATLSAHRIALYSNRAACYLKLQKFKEASEECSAILELDHNHKGALMLRAQTLVALKDYHCALFDVNRLLMLNPTSEVYREFQARLRTQLALAPIPEAENEFHSPESPRIDHKVSSSVETYDSRTVFPTRVTQAKIETTTSSLTKLAVSKGETGGPSFTSLKEPSLDFPNVRSSSTTTKAHPGLTVLNSKTSAVLSGSPASADKETSHPKGWDAIPKPKGHTGVDYSRWSGLGDDVSDDETDEDSEPQYRYRLRTIGLRAVNT